MAKRRRRRSWSRTLLLIVFVSAAVYAGVHCLFRAPQVQAQDDQEETPAQEEETDPEAAAAAAALAAHTERKDNFYTILVSGVDDGNGGSDTNILVAVDAENGKIHGVSIPRDTKAVINGKNHKINFAYNSGGSELLARTISEQLGIPVDFTVTVDLTGFVALVDAIGGVDFYVPIDMNYDDPIQGLSIHFSKGMQHLSGQEAMEVVRFRHNNDGGGYPLQDLDRIKTQQAFLKAVADKMFSLQSVIKVPEFARIFFDYVDSDLTVGEMVWFGNQALSIGTENIAFHTLPGAAKTVYGGSYYVLDEDACLELVNSSFNPYREDLTTADLDIKSA